MRSMGFTPEQLRRQLEELPPARRYWVGFSGGLDSHVLLHTLAALRLDTPLQAVHIHHGLSPHAEQWATHCAAVAADLGVPFTLERVDATPARGESPEAAARQARYTALARLLGEGEMLLTAHQQNDQAETLLLQLLRGAGPRGLAAMPRCRPFAAGWQARPLLGVEREALQAYAREAGLAWVEDESNFDTGFDRNYLRREIMPALARRWPAVNRVLGRSAAHFAESSALLDELAALDLAGAEGERPGSLSVAALLALSPARCHNLLRYWLRGLGLPLPDTPHLLRIGSEVLAARPDAEPQVDWPGAEVRRYRDGLYAMPPLAPPPTQVLTWDLARPLQLPAGLGRLTAEMVRGRGLQAGACTGGVEVRFRHGGESCHPAGRGHRHSLKKLLQEAGVAPWERERLPLLYVDGELAQVGELCCCDPYAASKGEPGVVIHWQRPQLAIETGGENDDN